MPQKRRLELKPHRELKTREFYPTKKFVFVLDLQDAIRVRTGDRGDSAL